MFSGTVATGQKVRIQGLDYRPGCKEDLNAKSIQRTVGELHVEICLKDLRDFICGDPVVSDRETVADTCTEDSCSYTATNGTCETSSFTTDSVQGSVTGYKDVSKVDG